MQTQTWNEKLIQCFFLERKEKNKQYTALTVRRDFTSQGRKKNNLRKQKSEGNAILLIFSSWPEAWYKLKFLITKENKVRNVLNGRENFPTFPEIRYPGWQKQHFPNLASRKAVVPSRTKFILVIQRGGFDLTFFSQRKSKFLLIPSHPIQYRRLLSP